MDFNDVKDFVVETKEVALNRLKYPLLKFYIFFIIICNWDIILFIFLGDADINMRITSIKNSIKETELYILGVSIHFINLRWLMPMIYSLVSYLLFPYISYEIEKIISKVKNQQMDLESQEKLKIAKSQYEISLELSGKRSYDELNAKISILEKEKEENFRLYQQTFDEKETIINQNRLNESFFNEKMEEYKNGMIKAKSELQQLELKIKKESFLKIKMDQDYKKKLTLMYFINKNDNPNNYSNNKIDTINESLYRYVNYFFEADQKLENIFILKDFLKVGEIYTDSIKYDRNLYNISEVVLELGFFDKFDENKYIITEIGKKIYEYMSVLD
ncbi:hypothetical protein HX001_00025 [Empedobacter brevis]|uniref:Uncharacterized protein n=1 Tax=Empedobacter brevis TaxID=247 RepID=A0AAJ1QAE5_9FLAO|nr:hypothetical protein [Empedobacter brevis]MDM1070871.1 hypothetical protein [Empedobacter brevis]